MHEVSFWKKNVKSWQTEFILVYKVLTCRKQCFGPMDTFSASSITYSGARGWQPHGAARLGRGLKSHGLAEEGGNVRVPARGAYHPILTGSPMSATLG